jgi:nucleotide-binding universal stress UspA family protein
MKERRMPKLLVPIDGSESSMRALDHAMNIANSRPSYELHLLTVHPEPIMYGEILVYVSQEKMHELQKAHSMDLLRPAVQAAEQAQIRHTSEIVEGEIAPTIVKRANELRCEGIVMGTRGMTAISNLVIGSVATKVIHLTNVPVTLVK